MEQSLPHISAHKHISAHNKELQPKHQEITATPAATNRTTESDAGYDTRLIPHISLPQRYQASSNGQRAGLLHSTRQQDPALARHTTDYTTEFRRSDLKQAYTDNSAPRWNTWQTPPTPGTFQQAHMQNQQASVARARVPQQNQYAGVRKEERRRVVDGPDWRLTIEQGQAASIAHQRMILLVRALVSLIMFTGITYAIWTIFSHNSLYTLILFTVLAVALGTILSISLGDYYQLVQYPQSGSLQPGQRPDDALASIVRKPKRPGDFARSLWNLKTSTLPLPAVRVPMATSVRQGRYRAPLPGEQHFKVPRRPIEHAPLQQEKKPGTVLTGHEGKSAI